MNEWRILFTTLHGRRPRLAVAILLAVMFALVTGQAVVPYLAYAWIPLGLLLAFLLQQLGWLVSDPTKVIPEPPPALKVASAVLGVVVLVAFYVLYQLTGSTTRTAEIAVLTIGPVVALVLWLIFRRKSY